MEEELSSLVGCVIHPLPPALVTWLLILYSVNASRAYLLHKSYPTLTCNFVNKLFASCIYFDDLLFSKLVSETLLWKHYIAVGLSCEPLFHYSIFFFSDWYCFEVSTVTPNIAILVCNLHLEFIYWKQGGYCCGDLPVLYWGNE